MTNKTILTLSFALAPLVFAGCAEDNDAPAGLERAEPMGGAKVIFDLAARPLPEIPFPNNVATRIDPTSPTGLRVNVSEMAATHLEVGVREQANTLDGFSTYGAIYVSFTEPLDIQNILDRHTEPTPDFRDDAVYLVNIDRSSSEFGKLELLDLGRGNFPVTMRDPAKYFDFDPRANGTNLVFESVEEVDANKNGVLDPVEDTDDDLVWDKPNVKTPGADPLAPGQMLEFYERETNTLHIRPLDALQPGTTYAVVLTKGLLDENGVPIDSPFPFVNHTRQTDELEPLRQILPNAIPGRFDAELEQVRFAWTFTTQTTTLEIEELRKGMYGVGNFSWLADLFPADLKLIHRTKADSVEENVLLAPVDRLLPLLVQVFAEGSSPEAISTLVDAGRDIDYIVSGSFITPYFLTDKDGLAGTLEEQVRSGKQYDDDESFEIDLNTGEAIVGQDEVTWMCAVPKAMEGRQPPFPVVIYGHGYGSARVEAIGFAGQMSKFGLVTCAIDNVGHGLPIDQLLGSLPIDAASLVNNIGLPHLLDAFGHGRQRDLTNDGLDDPGGDYWTADTFHTRDMVRQTTIDYMQFIRIMRTWDGSKRWPAELDATDPYVQSVEEFVAGWDTDLDGEPEIAGDFNGDGVVDFGGPQPYYAWGQSLGGIQSAVLAGVDPAVRGAAPTAGGAGLGDIAVRSTQTGVPEAVLLRMMGPLVLGRPQERWNAAANQYEWTGSSQLEFLIPDAFQEIYLPFATVDDLDTGDCVVYRNLTRETRTELVEDGTEASYATVRDGIFRTGIAADAVNTSERAYELGFDTSQSVRDLHRRAAEPEAGLTERWYLRRGQRGFQFEDRADNIDFEWTEADTTEGFRPQEHSVLWEGVIQAGPGGLHTFRAEVDGRVEVFVNGRRIIDVRDESADARVTLEEGEWYDFRVEYDRTRADGHVRLYWSSDDFDEEIIPASAFQTHLELSADEAAELPKHIIENPRNYGDPFVVEIYTEEAGLCSTHRLPTVADEQFLKRRIDTFERDVYYQNVLYPKGSPLAALTEGWGMKRQTPSFRRFMAIAQMILDKADPGNYAEHYFEEPLDFSYEEPQFQDGTSNVLVVPTNGDSAVPVNTGISLARVAGILDASGYDARYGMTENQYLAENYVYEGISWLNRFPEYPGALFDADNLDAGQFSSSRYPERGFDPNPDAQKPVRATVQTSAGVSAMRIPYTRVDGEHGFDLPDPNMTFDVHTFMANQIGYYFANGGRVLEDDPCMQAMFMEDCEFFDYETWSRPPAQ